MNRRWVQDLLVVAVFTAVIFASAFDDTAPATPAVVPIIEQAKQTSLADPKFNELYREGKRMTGMGDDR